MSEATFIDILERRAAAHPTRRAFTFLQDGETETAQLTFAQLRLRARSVAARLQSVADPGARALLIYSPGLEFIVAFFACLYAGIVAVPTTPPRRNQHGDRIRKIIDDAAPVLVLTGSDLRRDLAQQLAAESDLQPLELLATDAIEAGPAATGLRELPLDGATPAFLQYTSGSTSDPKGVVVSHRNLVHNQQMICEAFGHDDNTVFVGWLPVYHDMGLIGNVLQPLFLGVHCVLMPPMAFTQKPVRWLRAISHYRGTTSGAPNFAYDLCARAIKPEQRAGLDLSSWRVAFNGAEPVRAATLTDFTAAFAPHGFKAETFYPCYGMAEATLLVSGAPAGTAPRVTHVEGTELQLNNAVVPANGGTRAHPIVSCGRAWGGQTIAVVDPGERTRCEPGEIGEIWVAGPSVARGYWKRSGDAQDIFGARLPDDSNAYLRTGDLGFVLDGDLYVTGRLKDLIIECGRNHYPQDIEATVGAAHEEAFRVGSCAAFTVCNASGQEQLVVVQEVARLWLRKADCAGWAAAVRERVSKVHGLRVHDVVFTRPMTIPRTTSEKIRRSRCRELYVSGELQSIEDGRGVKPFAGIPCHTTERSIESA